MSNNARPAVEDLLRSAIPAAGEITHASRESRVASLWAGYGSVVSLTAKYRREDRESEKEEELKLIVKRVNPPGKSGRGGGAGSLSHRRKMRSYEIEASFYRHAQPLLVSSGVRCAVPQPYSIETTSSSEGSSSSSPSFTFVLSDLRTDFPLETCDRGETLAALRWLAAFHAAFWELPDVLEGGSIDPISLWECGGYWHLDTRPDELDSIDDGGEFGILKRCARAIDKRMRDGRESGCAFHTLCHGDFKAENLMYSRDGGASDDPECAAVDFQYTGGGYGMKDVVMFLVSSVSDCNVEEEEESLLEFYRARLIENLRASGRVSESRIAAYTKEVAQMHYELCLMDYVRFMAGWGFWGYNSYYAQERVQKLLREVEEEAAPNKKKKKRDIDWEGAIYRRFPFSGSI